MYRTWSSIAAAASRVTLLARCFLPRLQASQPSLASFSYTLWARLMPAFPLRAVLLPMSIFALILGTMSWLLHEPAGAAAPSTLPPPQQQLSPPSAAAAAAHQPPSAPSASHPSLLPPPPSSSPPLSSSSLPTPESSAEWLQPDYRLKWLGSASAKAVSVSGDWNNWSTTAGVFAMARDDDGVFAANIFLPERCPRKNLIMAGVCCYRYKFYIEFGTRRRWQHDPRQPMDKDPDGWVNNFMCKYANGHDGKPMRTIPHASRAYAHQAEAGNSASGPLSAAGGTVAAAKAAAEKRAAAQAVALAKRTGRLLPPPPPPLEVCLVLPATYFNGSTLGTASTRGLGACCDVCRRRQGCAAYNWRPEPLGRNCVLFGAVYGVPRGTALCSAGIVKVPLAPPPPPPPPQLVSPRHQDGRGRKRRRRKGKQGSTTNGNAVGASLPTNSRYDHANDRPS